jgi:hypothetical protein
MLSHTDDEFVELRVAAPDVLMIFPLNDVSQVDFDVDLRECRARSGLTCVGFCGRWAARSAAGADDAGGRTGVSFDRLRGRRRPSGDAR